jgi:murein DD-endopeptidase MepM/ murein hydrolase activator NlpD
MMRRHTTLAFTFVLASAACATLMVTGCSDPAGSAVDGASEPHTDLHADDDGDMGTPNDDPALGADVDVDTQADAEMDLEPDFEFDTEALERAELASEGAVIDGQSPSEVQAARRVRSPVPGRGVTYRYGVRNPRYAAGFHTGDDYAAPKGTRVVAVRSGRIRWSNNNGGAYGKWMGLDADNGRTYVYCHLSKRLVAAGTKVKAGKLIGRVGATGNVTGPHLHFEDHPRGPFVYARVREPRW